jgi:signal peptidase I
MKKVLKVIWEMAETIIIAGIAVYLVRTYIVQPFLVSGESMLPNFRNGDYLLVDELTYRFREPERGEVIVLRYPKNEGVYFIKRVIGLPGETVIIENNNIIILNKEGKKFVLNEPYIRLNFGTMQDMTVTLKENEYFVMGDNRSFSFDSRNWGVLPRKDIIGLVRFRLWPFNSVMAFSSPHYEYASSFQSE